MTVENGLLLLWLLRRMRFNGLSDDRVVFSGNLVCFSEFCKFRFNNCGIGFGNGGMMGNS